MDRRAFLRATALTAAGLYVAPDLLAKPRRKVFPVGIDLRPRIVEAERIDIRLGRVEKIWPAHEPEPAAWIKATPDQVIAHLPGGVAERYEVEAFIYPKRGSIPSVEVTARTVDGRRVTIRLKQDGGLMTSTRPLADVATSGSALMRRNLADLSVRDLPGMRYAIGF